MRAQSTFLAGLLFGLIATAPRAVLAQPTEPEPAPVEEATPVEEAAPVEEKLDPQRPPARGKGALWGIVKSRQGETLLEALVSVIGRKEYATTDEDGRFRLELPPGTYQLRV